MAHLETALARRRTLAFNDLKRTRREKDLRARE